MTNVSGGQGIQVGSGSVQNNFWPAKGPLDAATLTALSPHAAVARIRQMSHDDAVDFFARASAEDLTGPLRALLLADEATAVAVLADLGPRKVTEMTEPFAATFPWLADLPEAAEAIARQAAELGWDHDPGAGRLERAAGADGYARKYQQGVIVWRTAVGASACAHPEATAAGGFLVRAEVARCADKLGGTWHPVSDEVEADPSLVSGLPGLMQRFEDDSGTEMVAYTFERTGTHPVAGGILEHYEDLGGPGSWLGFPLGAWQARELRGKWRWHQAFEGGSIYHRDGHSPVPVASATVELIGNRIGWPVSEEQPAGSGTDRIQYFEDGVVTLRDGQREFWLRPPT